MSQDERQLSSLMPVVYDELRRIADRYMRHERPGQTIQATGLVNEAYLRLAAERPREFANRTHFVAIAALSMRQILVQRARARAAQKRGGAPERMTLDAGMLVDEGRSVDVIALDDALTELATFDPEQARIVELRYFGGLTVEEAADAVGVSPATLKREWAMARAWLRQRLEPGTV
ncbi:MAG: ECF-type sigma factor [Vicinamibacterales bacterium]